MTSNSKFSPLIEDALSELTTQGVECLGPALEKLFNELMLIEREQVLQAAPYERCDSRQGYANGFKNKMLQTRFGKLELQVPKTRDIPFYPSCLEKGTRSERALGLAIAEMYVNGVSTRRVKRITEKMCGLEISSTQVSRLCQLLDKELELFRKRPLGPVHYLYLDARYEKVRENGNVKDLALFTAIGVNLQGYREVLGVSCKLSEAEVHWRDFLDDLVKRGLRVHGMIISDDHSGLRKARQAVFAGTLWQRCIFHMAQNIQQYVPKVDMRGEVAQSLRDIFNARDKEEAIQRARDAIKNYKESAPRVSHWLEENCEEGMAFYSCPRTHWKKIRTNNASERVNQEIKRRTSIARLFPNEKSCERLATAIMVEIHEDWISGRRYLQV